MRLPLNSAAYQSRSVIANAQRCINLFPELNSEDAPVKYTHYLTPGLDLLSVHEGNTWRCLYRASNGNLYGVLDQGVYSIDTSYVKTLLGTLTTVATTPVSMADNGLCILIVDGSSSGYTINLTDNSFGNVAAVNFYGADRVDFLDTYFILNRPGTNQFYISLSQVTAAMLIGGLGFDPLDIAAKIGYPDNISSLIVLHREIWLVGTLTSEVWYNSGAADFTFQAMPGAYIEHGTVAKYSLATQDLSSYWLSQDKQGQAMVMRGSEYIAQRISTHAIEYEISQYETISDAVGMIYQQQGHTFYILQFPSANKTWVYDQSTQLWHQRCYTDDNGNLNRHRANCVANAYGQIIVGDYINGNLYAFNLNTYTDNTDAAALTGDPITRIRSFPQNVEDGNRVTYQRFVADMDVGDITSSEVPVVYLRWSDTKGKSWNNYLPQTLGATGEYYSQLQWQRLGYARDRVFELMWSADTKTALNGAFIDIQSSAT